MTLLLGRDNGKDWTLKPLPKNTLFFNLPSVKEVKETCNCSNCKLVGDIGKTYEELRRLSNSCQLYKYFTRIAELSTVILAISLFSQTDEKLDWYYRIVFQSLRSKKTLCLYSPQDYLQNSRSLIYLVLFMSLSAISVQVILITWSSLQPEARLCIQEFLTHSKSLCQDIFCLTGHRESWCTAERPTKQLLQTDLALDHWDRPNKVKTLILCLPIVPEI